MKILSIPLSAALALALLGAPPAFAANKAKAKPATKAAPAAEDPAPSADALIAQARGAAAKGDNELAERLAQSAIVAAPAMADTYIALGDVYVGAGKGEAARSYYQEALSIDPQQPAALKALAALDKTATP